MSYYAFTFSSISNTKSLCVQVRYLCWSETGSSSLGILSFFLRFIFFFNYSFNNDISLLLFLQFARQVSWCRSTNYLALPLLLITFLYEIWNLTFMFCSACNAFLFCAEERCLLRFFTWRLGNICLTKL